MTSTTEPAPTRFWTLGFATLLVFALGALLILVALGTWQVQRLAWKEDLLATIERRIASEPQRLDATLDEYEGTGDVEYTPTRAEGTFEDAEALFYATDRGTVGWQVLTPLRLAGGRALIVNRGFVPDAFRDPALRAPPPEGAVEVVGLARNPLLEKPRLAPQNDGEIFYWKDFPAIRDALRLSEAETLPFVLDAGLPGERYPLDQLPVPGQTIVSMPNNHFGYAVTWFGIAVALIGVVSALAIGRARRVRSRA